jgi:hypothetical protein
VPTDDCRQSPVPRRLALTALAALAGGAVASAVASPAAAQTDTTGPEGGDDAAPTTEPAPTTTAPPKKPTGADIELLGFAQSLEFAAAQLYGEAIPSLSEEMSLEATVFRRHHQAYGEQIGALLGRQAPGVPNRTLVDERSSAFGAGAEPAVLRAAYDLESSLAATNTQLLERLRGTDGLALIASIQPIEARQSLVLGQAVGLSMEELLPAIEGEEPGAEVFTPTQFPIA